LLGFGLVVVVCYSCSVMLQKVDGGGWPYALLDTVVVLVDEWIRIISSTLRHILMCTGVKPKQNATNRNKTQQNATNRNKTQQNATIQYETVTVSTNPNPNPTVTVSTVDYSYIR